MCNYISSIYAVNTYKYVDSLVCCSCYCTGVSVLPQLVEIVVAEMWKEI